eukprot:UN03598
MKDCNMQIKLHNFTPGVMHDYHGIYLSYPLYLLYMFDMYYEISHSVLQLREALHIQPYFDLLDLLERLLYCVDIANMPLKAFYKS